MNISCNPSAAYQKEVAIPNGKWSSSFQPEFTVDIPADSGHYLFYFLIRHDETYPNSNIWLNISVKGPGDRQFVSHRVELIMADPSGQWFGRNFGGMWEQKLLLRAEDFRPFTRKGMYVIRVEQLMRTDPLYSVMNVGVRLERVNVK